MSDLNTLQKLAEKRRSIYALSDELPVANDEVIKLVEHAIMHTPSSFNSQSTRVVVLLGDEHQKLWDITENALHKIVDDEENFKSTKKKIDGFKAGAGTILFFEDQSVVKALQEKRLYMQTSFRFGHSRPVRCTSMWFGRRWRVLTSVQICNTIIQLLIRKWPTLGIFLKIGS